MRKILYLSCGSLLLLVGLATLVVRACADEEIFRGRSPYNTVLVTEDGEGVRTLRFEVGGARQSVVKPGDPDHIVLPYAKAIHTGLALCETPKRVLIVGLGGGTIPQFLHRHFPELSIDVVDIDPLVVKVAREYFGFREDKRMRAYVEDGRRLIEQSEPVYDIIYLDAYSADNVPYSLATREFLAATRKAIRPGGIVVGNVWSSYSNRLYHSMVRTYQDVFDQVAIVDVPGVSNKIVIGTTFPEIPEKEALVRRAGSVAERAGFPYDLADAVEYGYYLLTEPEDRGEVLHDRD